jgi:hypothetical protein
MNNKRKMKKKKEKNSILGWGCSSALEHLPIKLEALSFIPSTEGGGTNVPFLA